uniref:Uncharacterized protein n=1 Tax=Anguilla anguilla TaxID=7936 RepID=A0A0E9U594_ANGAN
MRKDGMASTTRMRNLASFPSTQKGLLECSWTVSITIPHWNCSNCSSAKTL